jgi:hypothetical protein
MLKLVQNINNIRTNMPAVDLPLSVTSPNFINNGGCVLISDQLDKSHARRENFEDETGFEAFVNHIHIKETMSGEELKFNETLITAMQLAQMWKEKLSHDFPRDRFLIILSFDEVEGEVILRFHKVRNLQKPWVNMDGIEKYVEPVMVIEVGDES